MQIIHFAAVLFKKGILFCYSPLNSLSKMPEKMQETYAFAPK